MPAGRHPYHVDTVVHPDDCICKRAPECRGKIVGPRVPGWHDRNNLPARSVDAVLDGMRRLLLDGPSGPPGTEQQARNQQMEHDWQLRQHRRSS